MSYGDERRYGNQQSFGNRNGSGGGFQKNSFEDKSETPNPVKITSFYKADGKTVQEDLFDSVALNVAKSLKKA